MQNAECRTVAVNRLQCGRFSAFCILHFAFCLLSSPLAADEPRAELERLARDGMVEVLDRRIGDSRAPQDLALRARAQSVAAGQIGDRAMREAAFAEAEQRYAAWIDALVASAEGEALVREVAVCAARAELGGMLLSRWAAIELREFEISSGRRGDAAALRGVLGRAASVLEEAEQAAARLVAPLAAGESGAEQRYLLHGVYDAVWNVSREADANLAWARLYLAMLTDAAAPQRTTLLRQAEEQFRGLARQRLAGEAGARVWLGLAAALREQEQDEEAVRAADQAVQASAGGALEAQARCELARCHLRAERFQEARAVLGATVQAAARQTNSPAAAPGFYENLALVLDAKSHLLEAAVLERGITTAAAASALLRSAERRREDGLSAMARLAARGGPWPELVNLHMREWIRPDADPQRLSTLELLLTARVLLEQDDAGAALPLLRAAAERRDDAAALRGDVLAALGDCHVRRGDLGAAAEVYTELAQELPTHPNAPEAIDLARRLQARVAEQGGAAEDYRKLVRVLRLMLDRFTDHPAADEARWWLPLALQGVGEYAAAAEAFAAVPDSSPHAAEAEYRRLVCRRMEIETAAGAHEPPDAARLFAIAVELERYAQTGRRQGREAPLDDAAARRWRAAAGIEAARIWLRRSRPQGRGADATVADPGRALDLLERAAELCDESQRSDVETLRIEALLRLGRVEDALAAVAPLAEAAQGSAIATAATIGRTLHAELDRLETAEDLGAAGELTRRALPLFEQLAAAGGNDSPERETPADVWRRDTLPLMLIRLRYLAGQHESAEGEALRLLERSQESGALLRLLALVRTSWAQTDGTPERLSAAREAWERLLADPALQLTAPQRYWEARTRHLEILLRQGEAAQVLAAIRHDRVWRPELGGPPWKERLLALEARARDAVGEDSSP